MARISLRLIEPVNEEAEMQVMKEFLPQIRIICSNKIRAGTN